MPHMKEIVKAEPDGSLPIQWEKDTNLAGLPIPGGKAVWALHIGIFPDVLATNAP